MLSAGAAIFHLSMILYHTGDSPAWRHILFIVIGICNAYLLMIRPKYFVFLFSGLAIQQYYSHGKYLIELWNEKRVIHWISIGVLIYFLAGIILLIRDYKDWK